mmetsp:Transcript_10243/g.15302  ORF Transcript_10243/g.15302 Transcript_10243/m.15302 type:complete len:111 (+) Transcript_10243:192-524(+)|eukprot:CAMPEP_0194767554 /NCGR_PEP_ID=MMETSP0323_2-20130528/36354_1 /TAXON_ID=2866 ORGANISM="Crypthecodinium cohnii, Strain Seligo" /NCGR_SAMPLE_ID=MMETSP0323_2 /ASSEMBLY_ACC=CAM_ASM_000346 /LENGTH=110 /DNA_ID=CAMNT_0039699363 /DNA_START=160 /DNA_END=492 /DNA_ORIENTATION=+
MSLTPNQTTKLKCPRPTILGHRRSPRKIEQDKTEQQQMLREWWLGSMHERLHPSVGSTIKIPRAIRKDQGKERKEVSVRAAMLTTKNNSPPLQPEECCVSLKLRNEPILK